MKGKPEKELGTDIKTKMFQPHMTDNNPCFSEPKLLDNGHIIIT